MEPKNFVLYRMAEETFYSQVYLNMDKAIDSNIALFMTKLQFIKMKYDLDHAWVKGGDGYYQRVILIHTEQDEINLSRLILDYG